MTDKNLSEREELLAQRLQKIEAIEQEIAQREKAIKQKESARKQLLLRLSPTLYNDIAAWAEEDFRSINGQIEFLLSEAVKKRKGK